MAMNRKIRDAIVNAIREQKAVTVDEVAEIVRTYDEMPDIANLVEQHYRRKARRFLSAIRDENGERDFFAVKDIMGASIYVNIPATDNMLHLNRVDEQLEAKSRGITKSRVKVRKRQREIAGQLAFDFAVDE